jgi:hypothetical protein
MFVKEVLVDNALANTQAVNEAWRAAGMKGTISATLVNKLRSRMGLAGNLRGGRRKGTGAAATAEAKPIYTGKRRGRPPKQAKSQADETARLETRRRQSPLVDLEVDIDRILFKAMEIGTLPEVEDALRRTRRLLYAGLTTKS